ncbi:SLC13 family permease [Paenibacillus thermotolerans]|uniref:SLC13 family permease n=1 Tax=Paenibacillus thermotolerans TaxID=3027807 RepID=UPI002368DEBC|nr:MULTISPECIES: SLC13 family permease [unclassified Paenibacillus]
MAIKQIEMFKDLSKLDLAKLLGKLERITLKTGDTLFEQGDPGDRMYIIEDGKLELYTLSAEGSRQVLAVLGEGDTLGEMALLTQEPRSAAATAITDVDLYVIDRETFDRLIEEQASLSKYFIRLLSKRLVTTNERLQQSNELRTQRVMAELDQLPETIVAFLLWGSEFPALSSTLIQEKFQFSPQELCDRFPQLQSYLRADPQYGECWFIEHGAKSLLYDLATTRFGHQVKRQWNEEALSFYLRHGQQLFAARLFADKSDWPAAFSLIEQYWSAFSEQEKAGIHRLLKTCPLPLIASNFSFLLVYLSSCYAESPEEGISALEYALENQTDAYSAQQLIAIYEWGAKLSEKSGKSRQAMEYIRLAESALMTTQADGNQRAAEGYGMARQKLNQYKNQLLAEGASRLIKRSKLTGVIAVALSILVIILFYRTPPVAGLSPQAMAFIGVGVAAVILWVVNIVPDYIVALGMLMFWVLGGLVEPAVAFSGFASTTWFYMIFIMALSAAVIKSGILFRFALYALKWFPSHYRGQLWGTVIGGLLLNPLIPSSSAKVTLGVPVAQTLTESMGFAERSRGASGLGLTAMIFYGFTAPFVLTGSYTNMMAFGLISGGVSITWLQWFLYGLPAFVMFGAVILTVFFLRFGKLRAPRPISMEVLDEQLRLLGPLSKDERLSLWTVVGSVGLMILQPLYGVESTWVMMAGFAVLVITGALDRQTISTGIDWTFLLFLGVAFGFAGGVGELGITDTVSEFLGNHLSMFTGSPYIFLLTVIAVCFLVTLVVRDDPAVILLVTALLPLAQSAGIHPWIVVFVILLGTDPFFFTYQSPTYLTAYYSSEGKSFTHRQGQKMAVLYAAAVIAAVLLSVPYWKWIGLIS